MQTKPTHTRTHMMNITSPQCSSDLEPESSLLRSVLSSPTTQPMLSDTKLRLFKVRLTPTPETACQRGESGGGGGGRGGESGMGGGLGGGGDGGGEGWGGAGGGLGGIGGG